MSRDIILSTIRKNNIEYVELPEIPDFSINKNDKTQLFAENLKKAGGELVFAKDISLEKLIQDKYNEADKIVSVYDDFNGTQHMSEFKKPHELRDVKLAVINGEFGVAENGAIWIEGNTLVHRALPFITENLIIILKDSVFVENMHQAYEKVIDTQSKFGVFIAGPSKTADIEQSLVIGAHGAKSLYVYIV